MGRKAERLIEAHEHFVISTHHGPDGDGVGSAVALQELLRAMGKSAEIWTATAIPACLDFLQAEERVFEPGKTTIGAEVLISVDCHRPDRIGALADYADSEGWMTLCIDHHPQVSDWGSVQIIDPSACAAGILVYELYQSLEQQLSPRAATGLYTSLYSDTGRFAHGCEDGRAHLVAATCVQSGADPEQIHHALSRPISEPSARFLAQVVTEGQAYCEGEILVQTIHAKDLERLGQEQQADLDPSRLHSINRGIKGIKCAVILLENPTDEVRVSIRCQGGFDIGRVMGFMGGGGHPKAAGATWRGSLNEVKNHIVYLVESELRYQKDQSQL